VTNRDRAADLRRSIKLLDEAIRFHNWAVDRMAESRAGYSGELPIEKAKFLVRYAALAIETAQAYCDLLRAKR